MDTPHQEDLTRLLARKRRQPSAIEDERAVRRPQSTSGTDEGFSTARSFPGAPTGLVRLDPARGVADDTQWKSAPRAGIPALAATRAAKSSHASAERCAASPDSQPNHAWSVEMLGTGGLPTFESERRVPLPDDGREPSAAFDNPPEITLRPLVPIVPDRVAGAVGGRSWRWLAPTQMLGRLRLLLGRSAAARAIVNRPFWQKAPAASASDPFEPEDALSPRELPPVVQAVERVDKAEAPLGPSCSAAAASPAAVVFVRSEAKPEMAEPGAPLFAAKTAGEVSAKVRGEFHLGQGEPIFLFAGEMSYAAGADLLTDALITVCQDHQEVQFALVGDGSLRSDLEAQVERAGFTHRCRFTGSLLPDAFERLLTTCDALVIPARERQDSRLAERVALLGKPLLTTHQAQIRGIVHGQNGLVAYDCANSLVWGLRELIAKPLRPRPHNE